MSQNRIHVTLQPRVAATLGIVLALVASVAFAAEPDHPALHWDDDLSASARKTCVEAERLWKAAEKRPSRAALDRAIEALGAAQKAARRSPLPPYYQGIAYQFTGEYTDARRVLKRCVELAPSFPQGALELADNYCHMKKYREAHKFYLKAQELAPEWNEVLKRRAMLLHVAQGDFEKALADLDRAAEIDPKDKEVAQQREQVRRAFLGPDWEKRFEAESEHYRISTNVSQEFADLLAHRSELIHRLYQSIFGEPGGKGRKFPIIVYASKNEYHANGGPSGAGGHYSPNFRSLELFKYPKQDDTLLVLHHEGFHQFMHTFIDHAPQWFNEGLGDFFGPSKYVKEGKKEFYRTQPNPWRLQVIKRAIKRESYPEIKDLMLMTQQEMYSGDASLHYAMAWSLIYFCCERRNDSGQFMFFTPLRNYLKELRKGSGQQKAFDRTFGKLDMERFETEWRRFTLQLR